jgi:hypothetical protein
MKKIFVLLIVVALLAVTVVPALADGNGNTFEYHHTYRNGSPLKQAGSNSFALSGTIAALNPGAGTVTVSVACGNILVQPYVGQDVTLETTGVTRFLLRNPSGVATPITFADLAVGQKVSANGELANNAWTASRITVGASLACLP